MSTVSTVRMEDAPCTHKPRIPPDARVHVRYSTAHAIGLRPSARNRSVVQVILYSAYTSTPKIEARKNVAMPLSLVPCVKACTRPRAFTLRNRTKQRAVSDGLSSKVPTYTTLIRLTSLRMNA